MADEKQDDTDIFDELVDAANLFEEIESAPVREDVGDILFVEGIEEDESVVDEDINGEDELVMLAKTEGKTVASIGARNKRAPVPRASTRRRPKVVRKKKIAVAAAVPAAASIGDKTIGELFVPLVRHSPVSKIRVERDSIASIFSNFIVQVQT